MPEDHEDAVCGTTFAASSVVSAMIPPSPRLWARMMKPAYLIDTSTISAQKISDEIPYTPAGVDVGGRSVRVEDDLLGVERARTDIAVDDPERPECEHEAAGVRDDVALVVGRGSQRVRRRRLAPRAARRVRPVAELVARLVEALPGPRPGRSRSV